MACKFINPHDNTSEIELSKTLREYYKLNNSEKANAFMEEKMSLFFSKSFRNIFGDWVAERLPEDQRINHLGEPRLFQSGEHFYVLDKNNEKYFINNRRFEGLEALSPKMYYRLNTLRDETSSLVVRHILDKYAKTNSDITDIDSNVNIKDEILNFFNQQIQEDPRRKYIELFKKYIDDFEKDTIEFLSNINIQYNTAPDSTDESYQEDLEDSNELIGKSSIEKNNKDNATANVKLMLSLLPDTTSKSEFYNGYKMLPLSSVWNDMLDLLTNVPKVLSPDGITLENPLNVMIERIKKEAVSKPYLKQLVTTLENSSPNLQTQFVQAFGNNGKYIQDTTIVNTETSTYKTINAAESSSKSSKILTEAGEIFKTLYTNTDTSGVSSFDFDKYNTLRNNIVGFVKNTSHEKGLFTQYRDAVTKDNKALQDQLLPKVLVEFKGITKDLGFDLNDLALSYYLKSNGKFTELTPELVIENIGNFITGFDYINKFIIGSDTNDKNKATLNATNVLFKAGRFLNLYKGENNSITSQTSVKNLAEAIGHFSPDLTENMFFAGDKQMWSYSLASHIYDVVNILNNDKNEVQNRLKLPFNQHSLYLQQYNNSTKNALNLHRISSVVDENNSSEVRDNITTSPIDAINVNVYEALLGKKPNAKSIFPTALAADKPTTLKLDVDLFINTYSSLNTDGTITLSDEPISIFVDYFKDEFNTANEAKEFIDRNTDEDGNVDISKLTQYKHVTADGYVYDILDAQGNSIFKSQEFSNKKSSRNNVSEIQRILEENPNKGFRKIYAGGFTKNFMMPSLSPEVLIKSNPTEFGLLYNSDFTPINSNDLVPSSELLLRSKLEEGFNTSIKDTLQRMVDLKIFTDGYFRNTFDSELYRLYIDELSNEGLADPQSIATRIAADYFINSTISQIEFSKIFNGQINNHKNAVDYTKRVPKTYIDGKGLHLGVTESDHVFKIAVLQDMETSSPYLDQMGEVGRKYYGDDKINQADAQGYITPERWKFLLERLGQFGKKEQKIYDKIVKSEKGENVEFTKDEVKYLSTKPLKGVYYSDINNDPIYVKYSQAVLLKSLVKGTPLEGLLNQMRKQGISEAVMNSGVKVGAKMSGSNVSEQLINKQPFELIDITLDNRYWKLQQDLPNKGFKETLLGSQIQKNIFDSFDFNSTYQFNDKEYTGDQVYNAIHDSIGELSNRGISKIISKFKITSDYKITDWNTFAQDIATQLRSEKLDENVIMAVEKELSPYLIPQAKDKILSTIMSIINKSAVKLKTNGASLIQMSNFGLDQNLAESTGIRWVADKQQLAEPRRIKQENGKDLVIPGQVFISGNLLSQYIPDWRNYSNEKLFGENGLFPKEILQMVGYRIPNQAMSSNDALQIVGILPDTYIDTIVPYTGITTKTGSDFDVDKMFAILPAMKPLYTYNKNLRTYINDYLKGNDIAETIANISDFLNDLQDSDVEFDLEEFKQAISESDNPGEVLVELVKGQTNELIKFITSKDNKSNPKVAALKKNIGASIFKVEYENYDEDLSIESQSTGAIQNRLFEMYHSILTQPSNYNNLITPIDHDHIKTFITKDLGLTGQASTDFKAFSALYQLEMKYEFIAGKFGIGQVANQLVDSMTNQVAQEYLDFYLGWGNFKEELNDKGNKVKKTVFDMKSDKGYYDETGTYKIADTLTALLNAFVDIAKDPFITRGNWNTQTTNTGAMLLRAGVNPKKVVAFLAQPSLKELTSITEEREGILNKDGSSAFVMDELKTKYLALIDTKLSQILDSEEKSIFMKELASKSRISNLTGLNISNSIVDRTSDQLINNLKVQPDTLEYYIDQYLALKEYDNLKPTVKEFSKSVSSAKYGETGAGKNMVEYIIKSNTLSNVVTKETIKNFSKKFYNDDVLNNGSTSLGYMHRNSEVFFGNLVNNNPQIFITGNEFFRQISNSIVSNAHKNKSYLDDDVIGKTLMDAYYAMLPSSSNLFKLSDKTVTIDNQQVNQEFAYLFKNNASITGNTLIKDIDLTKQQFREINNSNFFLEELTFKKDGDFTFIGVDGIRMKTNDYTKKMVDGWNQLNTLNPTLATSLLKYSYIQSGFSYNANQFYQFIPHEFFIKSNFNNYFNRLVDGITSNKISEETIKDNIYRHQSQNRQLVPQITASAIETSAASIGFKLRDDSQRHSGEGYIDGEKIKTYPEFVTKKGSTALFKLEGYVGEITKEGKTVHKPVYIKTHKLGYKSKKGQFNEFDLFKVSTKSEYSDNNLTKDEQEIVTKYKELISKAKFTFADEIQSENILITPVTSFAPKEIVQGTQTVNSTETLEETIDSINIYFGSNENVNLSNFAKRPFILNGATFNSVEQFYQESKLAFTKSDNDLFNNNPIEEFNINIHKQISESTNSKEIKKLGTMYKNLDKVAWDNASSNIMKIGIKASFEQNFEALELLKSTGNRKLTHLQDKGKWKLEFPKLLMEVRSELFNLNNEMSSENEEWKDEDNNDTCVPF